MNREIKFRAWDKLGSGFQYWGIGDVNGDGSSQTGPPSNCDRWAHEQYTGLKDKNGKEIYEGDIVEYKWLDHMHRAVVKWDRRRAIFFYSDKSFNYGNHLEVIGNLHENQELLK